MSGDTMVMIGSSVIDIIIVIWFIVTTVRVDDKLNKLEHYIDINEKHINNLQQQVNHLRKKYNLLYEKVCKTDKIWNIYYESNGQETLVETAETYDDAVATMNKLIKDSGFKSYYLRTTKISDAEFWFDYGSHTTFYWIREEEI